MKFNFVIFAVDFYCYETAYGDVIDLDNVRYIKNHMPKNKVINFLYRIHHSLKINKIISLPFKEIWFSTNFKNDFKDEKPICFLFFSRNDILEKYGYFEYLKKKYTNSKSVYFFQDLIRTHRNTDIFYIKKIFDLVISFDPKDVTQYNLEYFSLVNSKCKFDLDSNLKQSDIFFLGAAKNRLYNIISTYEKLKEKGFICDFYITGVKTINQKYIDDIHYVQNMSYLNNLKHIVKTNCILEIMQQGGHGFTQRMVEAIVYDKKIITNNPQVKSAPFYNHSNILAFENLDDISNNQLFFENFSRKADHHYKDEISPIKLLEFIAEKLEQTY